MKYIRQGGFYELKRVLEEVAETDIFLNKFNFIERDIDNRLRFDILLYIVKETLKNDI